MSDFVHLHCHSEYSSLDGLPKIEEYLIKASEYGMKGLAITEHGNLRSMVQLYIKSQGKFTFNGDKYDFSPIKPIVGCEFYIAPIDHKIKGLSESEKSILKRGVASAAEYKIKLKEIEDERQIRKRYHILVFPKNSEGLKNLLKLNHLAWKDGYYYRPRIDLDLLKKHSEGLMITTSCIGGWATSLAVKNKMDDAHTWCKEMKAVFNDDLYVEIQPHNIDDQRVANLRMIDIANDLGIKIVATNDCHYLEKDDWKTHNVLLAIQSRKTLQANDAWRFDDNQFYLKTKDEMVESFKKNHQISLNIIRGALENTMEIYDKSNISFSVGKKQGILPNVYLPKKFKGSKEYVISLCRDGWHWRDINKRAKVYAESNGLSEPDGIKIYKDRLKMELERIFKLKFEKYFIIIYELINWARGQDIMVGPGRGSSSGSLVCYLLGITTIDPIEYDLLFDRFLSESRMDYPDIDMDFEDERRKEVFKHLFDKYGEDYVCLVGTFGKMKGKQALQDVGRVMEIPQWETTQVTKHIIVRSAGDARASQSVEDSFNEFDVCKQYSAKYPMVLPFVKKLEGKIRQVGIHACGIQLTPMKIEELIPIEYRQTKNPEEIEIFGSDRLKVSAIDWRDGQDLGIIKIDVLGLRTLTVIKTALKEIEKNHSKIIDIEKVHLEDKVVLEGFTKGLFTGIFQFDSIGMKKTCEKLTFTQFEDVISLNALYRPGSMRSGLAQHYINRKIGKEKVESLHPIYDKITESTYGVLVYQEQLIKCFINLAGYHPGAADEIRKAVAKSFGNEFINKQKEIFINGAFERGLDKKKGEKLFENISFFGSYAFNKAHAAAYAVIAYWGMWLKIYYPTEFFFALMKCERDQGNILRFVGEARKLGIEVKTPDVNFSAADFGIIGEKSIISGLVDIKGCGQKASDDIVKKQPFVDLPDMLEKVNRRVVNKGVIKALVKSGALRSMYPNVGALLYETTYVGKNSRRKNNDEIKPVWEWIMDCKPDDAKELYDLFDKKENELDEEKLVKVMAEVCPIPPFKHKIEYYDSIDKYILKDRTNIDLYVTNDDEYDHELEFSDEGLKRGRAILKGIFVDVKYNNVGDFHKEEPDEKEKKRIGWGKRYSNLNIEDTLMIRRVNVDIDVFPVFRSIVDKGLQTPVLIAGSLMKWAEIFHADIIVDLDEFRDILGLKIPFKERFKLMNPYMRYFVKHPVSFVAEEIRKNSISCTHFKYNITAGLKWVVALVIRKKIHWTKKDKKMAFVDLEDETGYLSCVMWAEGVEKYGDIVKSGNVLKMCIQKDKSGYVILHERKITVIKTAW